MSIPTESEWRGAAAFFPPPVSDSDVCAAQCLVETIEYYNTRCSITPPLADIEYRSSSGGVDTLRHVFRWDRAPYDFVFLNGFEARRQANTSDEAYFNLELYVNSGGRPLDIRRDTTHAFVSTTLSSNWVPRVNPGVVEHIYRYEIYAPGGIWVAETLDDRYRYPAQDEVAFPAGIAPQYIRSAQLFELTGDRRYTRRRRVNTTLFINTNFNPQVYARTGRAEIQRPVRDYLENNQRRRLNIQEFPNRQQKRAAAVNDDSIIDYYIEGVTNVDTYFGSAFLSSNKNEAYMFMGNEYVVVDYSPATTNDRIINGPLFIRSGFPSLVGTCFAEHGIDAAFGCNNKTNEAFIFSDKLCAKIDYAPKTTDDKIIEGPKTIKKMFPFFQGTEFENGVDAAFESTEKDEAYLFKGEEYALINFSKRSLITKRRITEKFKCFNSRNEFSSNIEAAFASLKSNEAYLFKDKKYVLLHFSTDDTSKDEIIGGPKDIVPDNWPSLKGILPRKNRGLDYYEYSAKTDPDRDHDEL